MVRVRCDATTLSGPLLDILYLLAVLSKSPLNCEILMGDPLGTTNVDVARSVFQIFGELLSVTTDLMGELNSQSTLIFFYCLVILKNFGPVSRNYESMQFMDARVLKVYTRMMTLITKHTEAQNDASSDLFPSSSSNTANTAISGANDPNLSAINDTRFSWRDYSLFVVVQQAFAVALTRRPEIRPQLRDLKVLEEVHIKFLGRPPNVLPKQFATYLAPSSPLLADSQQAVSSTNSSSANSGSEGEAFATSLNPVPSNMPLSRLTLDPYPPMCTQIAVIEMLASAFLDLPSIRRWSAIGGFKLLINITLWVAHWKPDPNIRPQWESMMGSRKAAKARRTKNASSGSPSMLPRSASKSIVTAPTQTTPRTGQSSTSTQSSPRTGNSSSKVSSSPEITSNIAPDVGIPALPIVDTPSVAPTIAPLPELSERSGTKAGIITRSGSGATSAAGKDTPGLLFSTTWEIFNPRLIRIFEAFFHMMMCAEDNEVFSHRIMAALCGLFDRRVLATPENQSAREHLLLFPEAQLSFICLLNSLFSRNPRAAEEFYSSNVWETLLNSGFFLKTRDPLSRLKEEGCNDSPSSSRSERIQATTTNQTTVAASLFPTADLPPLSLPLQIGTDQSTSSTQSNTGDSTNTGEERNQTETSTSSLASSTDTDVVPPQNQDSTSSQRIEMSESAEIRAPGTSGASTSGNSSSTSSAEPLHPQLAAISNQLSGDLSVAFFKFIEHLGCTPGRNNETEVMILSSILSSPQATTQDKEYAAQTMSLMLTLNPVASANALVHYNRHACLSSQQPNNATPISSSPSSPSLSSHRASLSGSTPPSALSASPSGSSNAGNASSSSSALSSQQAPNSPRPSAAPSQSSSTSSKPFHLTPRPTVDEKRKNALNMSVSGLGRFLHSILDLIDLTVTKRGHFSTAEIMQLQSASTSLVIAINKLLSSESVKQRLQTDSVLLNDVILLLDDSNPHIFRFGLHTIVELLRGGSVSERASNPTFYHMVSNRLLDHLTKRLPSASLAFEIALLDSLASICTSSLSQSPATDLQDLVFQGHIKIFALLDRIVNDQDRWQRPVVIDALVAAAGVFSAMMLGNEAHQQAFANNGYYESLYHILAAVAKVQPLTGSLLIELTRIMMNGREEILHICMKLAVLPTRQKPTNPFILTTTLPPKRMHSSRVSGFAVPSSVGNASPVPSGTPSSPRRAASNMPTALNNTQISGSPIIGSPASRGASLPSLPPLPGNSEYGEVPGAYIQPNLLPSLASDRYENDEMLSPEAFEPPHPRAAALLFNLLTMFSPQQQILLLDMFNFLVTQAQSTNVTLSYFSAEGLLSKALSLIRTTTDQEISSRLFLFVGALGRHTITVRDIGHIFSLFKPLPGDFRPPWTAPLLDSLNSMIESLDTPPYYFHFDGVDAALIIPPLSRFPLGRGFTFSAWIEFEDFQDPLGKPNYQPRIISFLDNSGRGFELVVHRRAFYLLIHRDHNRTEAIGMGANNKEVELQPKTWIFVTLTYSVSTSILSKQGTFKLYFGDKLIDKVVTKQIQFNELAHCYIGSCFIHDNLLGHSTSSHGSNSANSGSSSSSTDNKKTSKSKESSSADNEPDSTYHRSTNRSFYGYMSEIAFFDEEISHQHVLAMRNGASKEAFLRNSEWNAVFDPMAQVSAISLTMSYSPRNTTATVAREQRTGYLDPYRTEMSQRFKNSDHASSALNSITSQQSTSSSSIATGAASGSGGSSATNSSEFGVVHNLGSQDSSSVVHICYDSSSYTRDAVMHKGLHIVHRTTIRSLISCVSGGANVLIPLIQLLDKSSELSGAQIQAKRANKTPLGNFKTANLTVGGSMGLSSSSGSVRQCGADAVNRSMEHTADEIASNSAQTSPVGPTGPGSGSRWSMAKVPRHMRPGSTTTLSTSPFADAYTSNGTPSLLKAIMSLTMNMLHASTELQLQIHLTRGFELISFLLVRSNPVHMSAEFLDLLKANMEPSRFPRAIQDSILEHLLLEAHLWIYTPHAVQQKLWLDCLHSIFIRPGPIGKFRSRVGAVSRLLEIIRIYYWETGSPANVMASEPVISSHTGEVVAQRPVVPHLRMLRKHIYSLISALILKENCEDDTMKREFATIMNFLRDCSDAILVSELLEYLEELYRKIPYYFERFLEWVHSIGATSILHLLDNRPLEVRVRVVGLINALIQSKFITQLSAAPSSPNTLAQVIAPEKGPVIFSSVAQLPSPLMDFPVVAIFDHLAAQPIDQALYDAIIGLVLLLPPYHRGKYLLNPDTGEASVIRVWPALAGLARLLSGRNVPLQTLFVDDFSFLITGNEANLDNMLNGAPTWPQWFLAACMQPAKSLTSAATFLSNANSSGSTSIFSAGASSSFGGSKDTSIAYATPSAPKSSPATTSTAENSSGVVSEVPSNPQSQPAPPQTSNQVDPLERLAVKSVDTLKNIAARILTHKSGAQLIIDWFCWFKAFTQDENVRPGHVDVEHFETLFSVVCKEIVGLIQREIDTAFVDESFQNFLTKSSVPVPPTQGGPAIPASKSFMLSLSNAVVALMTISEYVLNMWNPPAPNSSHQSVYAFPNIASISDSFGKEKDKEKESLSSSPIVPSTTTETGGLGNSSAISNAGTVASASAPNLASPNSASSLGHGPLAPSTPNSGSSAAPGSAHSPISASISSSALIAPLPAIALDDSDVLFGIGNKAFNVELILALLRVLEKLETELDRFSNFSATTPTELLSYRQKWGFRSVGGCSLMLRLTCALFGTSVKTASIRPFTGNITRAMSVMSRKVTPNEVHFAFYQALMNVWLRYKDLENPPESSWCDMISVFFVAPLAESNEVIALISSSKNYDATYTEFLRKFVAGANLAELLLQPQMEPLIARLKHKLGDLAKEEISVRKSARGIIAKISGSIRVMLTEEWNKVMQATRTANEGGSKAWERLLQIPRVLDPKVIRENYARTAYRWRDTLRVLKGETGPWGNNKATQHWKLSRVESSTRARPFFKKNYKYTDHRDAAYSAKIAKHGGGASAAAIAAAKAKAAADAMALAPKSIKRLSSYNLEGFLKSLDSTSQDDAEPKNDDEKGTRLTGDDARGSTEEDDVLASLRLDSRMGLPNADGLPGPVHTNSGTSNSRIASRISMMVGTGLATTISAGSPSSAASSTISAAALMQKMSPTLVVTCLWIRPMQVTRGTLEISPVLLRFKPIEIVSSRPMLDDDSPVNSQPMTSSSASSSTSASSSGAQKDNNAGDGNSGLPRERTWPVDAILEIRNRRYLLQQNALELFFADRTNHFFSFNGKERKDVFNTLEKYCPPTTLAVSSTPEQAWRSSDMTKRWQMRQISNFEYLMFMNTLGGRSFNDISQYPVFPWVVTDMTSPVLDLNDASIYRDLSKPIGALNPQRLENFLQRYESLSETDADKGFLYGSHYSSAATVLYFLIRMEPFTSLAIELQDGSFDIADRMFNSVPTSWANCQIGTTDVKELIPEFFYNAEFLVNSNKLPLGTLHTGEQAEHVVLPPWAKSPDDFVATMRRALESDYVSEHLHEWIDLIFGYKQRGQEALNAHNVFHYMSYEGMVNLDEITDPRVRHAAETSMREFGQTPCQVLRKPHPPRGTMPLPETLLSEFALRKDESFGVGKGRLGWVGFSSRRGEILTIDSTGKVRAMVTNLTSAPLEGARLPNDTPLAVRASSAYDNAVRISAPHLPQNVRTCVVSRDSTIVFSCLHDDNSIRCLALDSYRNVASLNSHKDLVTCLALSEDGALLVSGSKDTTVRVWAAIPGRSGYGAPFISLNDHDDEVICVAINSSLGLVASSSKDGTIILHYLNSSEYITSIRHPSGNGHVFDLLAISPLGYIVAYSHSCSKLFVYSLNGRQVHAEEAHESPRAMLLTKDGEFIITGGRRGPNGAIIIRRILPPAHDTSPKVFIIASAPIWSLCYAADENYLLAGLETGHLLIKDLPSKRLYIS